MRKNIGRIISAFISEECRKDKTLWTDGQIIRSYSDLIAARKGKHIYIKPIIVGGYSKTTSSHIRALWSSFPLAHVMDSSE